MPPLWEGDLLYMPITVPGISIGAATDILVRQDAALAAIPEVESVFGKAGKFDTPTDPSPLSMLESTINASSFTISSRDGGSSAGLELRVCTMATHLH